MDRGLPMASIATVSVSGATLAAFPTVGFEGLIRIAAENAYEGIKAPIRSINRFLGRSFLGRVARKSVIGYGIDLLLEEALGLDPGAETKLLAIAWALMKGDYSGAVADLVDAYRRARRNLGIDGQPSGPQEVPDALVQQLGRKNADP